MGEDGRGGKEGREKGKEGGKGKGREEGRCPPTQIPGSAPEQWGPGTDV